MTKWFFHNLYRWEKKDFGDYETLPCMNYLVALGFGQTGGNGQIVSFQFTIQYALFFQLYLLWYFSNYNKFAFF